MADRAEHWQTIDAFLAAGVQPAYLEAHPDVVAAADLDVPATPAPASPQGPAAPPTPAPAPSTPAPAPRRPLPFAEDRRNFALMLRKGTSRLAAAPRPGGIGPLVTALLVALVVVIPVAAGKTRLQHLIGVLTGDEILWSPEQQAAFDNALGGLPIIGNGQGGLKGQGTPTSGGGGATDLAAPPAQPAWKIAAALPYLPNTGRLHSRQGGQPWQL